MADVYAKSVTQRCMALLCVFVLIGITVANIKPRSNLNLGAVAASGAGTVYPSWRPPAGEVASISTNLMSAVDPCPTNDCSYSGGSGQNAAFAFGGGTYLPWYGIYGSHLQWNGGHNDGAGNQVYRFHCDPVAPAWTRITDPWDDLFQAGGGNFGSLTTGEFFADNTHTGVVLGQPVVGHSYAHGCALPPGVGGAGAYGAMLHTHIQVPSATVSVSTYSHCFDPQILTWVRFSDNANPISGYGPSCVSVERNAAYNLASGTDNRIAVIDLTNRDWATLSLDAFYSWGEPGNVEYIADIDMLSFLQVLATPAFVLIDPDNGNTYEPPFSGTPPDVYGGGAVWMSQLGVAGEWIYYPGSGTKVWHLAKPASSPTTNAWAWSFETMGGTAPITQYLNSTHHKRLNYAPDAGCLIWVPGGVDKAVQAFTLAGM